MSQINITIKSFSKIVKTLSVLSTDIIESKFEEIRKLFGYDSNSIIKIIYSGKVLNPSTTFEYNGIKNGECVVVMKQSDKAKPSSPAVPVVPAVTAVPTVPTLPVQTTPSTIPVPSTQMMLRSYWQIPATNEDTTPTYTFEQVYAMIPVFASFILDLAIRSPTVFHAFRNSMSNRNQFSRFIANEFTLPGTDVLLRQLMNQSPELAQSLRQSEGTAELKIITNPITGTVSLQFPSTTSTPSATSTTADTTIDAGTTTNTINSTQSEIPDFANMTDEELQDQVMQLMQQININNGNDNTFGLGSEGLEQLQQLLGGFPNSSHSSVQDELTDTDKENIQRVMEITGATEKMATSIYIQYGKNIEYTINHILSLQNY